MNARAYFAVSGAVFCLVCIAHLLRAIAAWPVVIDRWTVPMSVSWIGAVVTGLLAAAALRLLSRASG